VSAHVRRAKVLLRLHGPVTCSRAAAMRVGAPMAVARVQRPSDELVQKLRRRSPRTALTAEKQ